MTSLKPLAAIFILVAVFFAGSASANRIDSLQTDAEVLTFLKAVNKDFNVSSFELRSTEALRKDLDCDGMSEKWQIKNWEKVDFNNDKLTDLLIMPYWFDYGVYVVMDRGNNKFETLTLSYNIYEKCELAKSADLAGEKVVMYYQRLSKLKNTTTTLVYKYGNFVEYNANPSNYQIDSISFRTNYCLGSCPVFSISTDKNGNAVYEAGAYNPKMGTFRAMIQPEVIKEMFALINYMDLSLLNNEYKVSWKDDQTAWLRIHFSNGTVKEIKDYGMKGSFGLRLIYNRFFELRSTQAWK
jgi:hypothetical protein